MPPLALEVEMLPTRQTTADLHNVGIRLYFGGNPGSRAVAISLRAHRRTRLTHITLCDPLLLLLFALPLPSSCTHLSLLQAKVTVQQAERMPRPR